MTTATNQPSSSWKKWLIYLLVLIASVALIWSQLPRGAYPTDLTRIGQGKPALVVIYDVNTAGGMQTIELLKELREKHADQIEFLVASHGLPEGRRFEQQYDVKSGMVVFFLADGRHARTMRNPQNTEMLRQALEEILPK